MTEILFARQDDVDAAAAIAASATAVAAASAAEGFAGDAEDAAVLTAADVIAAEAAKADAEAALAATLVAADGFDDVYLGSKAANPTLDNDGNALVEGQLYWNSVSNDLRVYTGAAWASYSGSSGIANVVEDTSPQLGGNLDLNSFVITGLVPGTNIFKQRTFTAPAAGFSIANGDGVSANPTFSLANDLAALEALGSTGIAVRTGSDAWAQRTITGTASQITVTDGSGAAGNPTLSFPADVLIPTVLTVPNGGLHILDTNATHDLIITPGSNLTADRVFTLTTGDAARTLDISAGSVTISTFGGSLVAAADAAAAMVTLDMYNYIPQNSKSAAYTLVLGDQPKHIFHPSADTTARIWTIPANSSVAFPVGTAITFINQNSAGVITIAITTDTMRLAGPGTTGSRTLAANGIATAVKVTTTEWIISGTGLT